MARTRSKSNAETSTSITDDSLKPLTLLSPLRPSDRPSTIKEEAAILFKSERAALQNSPSQSGSRQWTSSHARVSRLAAIRVLDQFRKRLDIVDEHSRELCTARHILIKREGALIKERDELVTFLESVELAILASSTDHPDWPGNHQIESFFMQDDEIQDDVNVVDDDWTAEFQPPSERKAITNSASGVQSTTQKCSSDSGLHAKTITRDATTLAPSPTLIEPCPTEHLQPSTNLPQPIEPIPNPNTPALSPSIKRNGIRFPPGSAPRPPRDRSRSSSPFTQMLPPPVPASSTTPRSTKPYAPIITDFDIALLDPPIPTADLSLLSECALPVLPPRPTITPERRYRPLTQFNPEKEENTIVPIYLLAHNKSPISWEIARLGPERTPSPPIGGSRLTWASKVKIEGYKGAIEPEGSALKMKMGQEKTMLVAMDVTQKESGPASRTRARVSNAGTGVAGAKWGG